MRRQQQRAAGWVGHVLAGHRIDALIGEGGMGVVYRATHLTLRRTVALKVLPPALAADAEFRRRFEREATIAASLEHPAVVPIYDAGHENGVLYLSMRFVEGEDLGAVLRRDGPLDVARLCGMLEPIADALDAVHEAGLVHRDVKPGNVLISRPGRSRGARVYLCDFGIAKGAADGSGAITSAGQYFGTLQYSSPEQIQGRWIDGRSDQYGLACLAFHGLTGRVPYPRDDSAAVIYAHLVADPPRPRLLRPELPAAVDAVLARAAAKDPGHRFPRCSAFVAALRSAASPSRPVGPPSPRRASDSGPSAVPPHRAPAEPAAVRPGPAPAPPRRSLPPTRPLPEHEVVPAIGGDGPAGVPDLSAAPTDPEQPAGSGPDGRPAATGAGSRAPAGGRADRADPADGDGAVPAPVDVRAERDPGDPSITVTWVAGGPGDVEYKVSRLTADGRWRVVGRTRATSIIDGAVAAGAPVPAYGVVARLGAGASAVARSATGAPSPSPSPSSSAPPSRSSSPPPPSPPPPFPPSSSSPAVSRPPAGRAAEPARDPAPGPDGIPAVRDLAVSAPGTLVFEWPAGITEAMVVVRRDRPPAAPDDPAATSWKITNMRYQLDGGLLLPESVPRPCHVAVASCRRERGALVVAARFDPSARTSLDA